MGSSADTADRLFSRYEKSIFQVRIVDINSGSQSAIGSGFLVADGSLLATNYHVVSSLVDKPERYRAEVDKQGSAIPLSLLYVDVVNDLALLQVDVAEKIGPGLILGQQPPQKGESLYAIGNPLDIGMTVVEGNYNGYVEHRFLDKIHYSGAINPGMSGGPTVDINGEVIGINVATAGNQIGFLVPVSKLRTLVERAENSQRQAANLYEDMAQQISRATSLMLQAIMAEDWPEERMGQARIIGQILPAMECWGNSHHDEDKNLKTIGRGCSNQERIYITDRFDTGFIEYEFHHYSAEQWPAASFYRYLEKDTSLAIPGNKADKNSANNFTCHDQVVQDKTPQGIKRKINFCTRSYKKLKGLYDVFYLGVSINKKNTAITEHFTLSGVTQEASQKFLQRFARFVAWQ